MIVLLLILYFIIKLIFSINSFMCNILHNHYKTYSEITTTCQEYAENSDYLAICPGFNRLSKIQKPMIKSPFLAHFSLY